MSCFKSFENIKMSQQFWFYLIIYKSLYKFIFLSNYLYLKLSQPLFATMTNLKLVVKVVLEDSGNLVAYDALGAKQWESGTTVSVSSKVQLLLGDDGNLVPFTILHFSLRVIHKWRHAILESPHLHAFKALSFGTVATRPPLPKGHDVNLKM